MLLFLYFNSRSHTGAIRENFQEIIHHFAQFPHFSLILIYFNIFIYVIATHHFCKSIMSLNIQQNFFLYFCHIERNSAFLKAIRRSSMPPSKAAHIFAANSGGNTVNTNSSFNIAERTIYTWKVMRILSMSCKKTFSN